MEQPTDTDIVERRRAYYREYRRHIRQTVLTEDGVSYHDRKQRQKPEYRERENLRKKNNRIKVKEWNCFKRTMPFFLTI